MKEKGRYKVILHLRSGENKVFHADTKEEFEAIPEIKKIMDTKEGFIRFTQTTDQMFISTFSTIWAEYFHTSFLHSAIARVDPCCNWY